NFRGEDTRKNFLGHLKAALYEKGIETFVDDDQLEKGKSISPQLLQAIEDSCCAIVILSPNYASSTWCLDELVKILDCMKTKGQIVIPIFYHVDPFDVRKQTGTFGEAFANHEQNFEDDMEKVKSWKDALAEVSNLAGLDSQSYRDDATFVSDIVEELSSKVSTLMSSKIDKRQSKKKAFIESRLYPCISATLTLGRFLCFFILYIVVFTLFIFKIFIPFFIYLLRE
ncbi:hypothetical protein TorRG33x02_157170, partial [Trema orientale]